MRLLWLRFHHRCFHRPQSRVRRRRGWTLTSFLFMRMYKPLWTCSYRWLVYLLFFLSLLVSLIMLLPAHVSCRGRDSVCGRLRNGFFSLLRVLRYYWSLLGVVLMACVRGRWGRKFAFLDDGVRSRFLLLPLGLVALLLAMLIVWRLDGLAWSWYWLLETTWWGDPFSWLVLCFSRFYLLLLVEYLVSLLFTTERGRWHVCISGVNGLFLFLFFVKYWMSLDVFIFCWDI